MSEKIKTQGYVSGPSLADQRRMLILDACVSFTSEHHYAPTLRELMLATGITSTSMVAYYLDSLEIKGYISRDAMITRSIVVLRPVYEGE